MTGEETESGSESGKLDQGLRDGVVERMAPLTDALDEAIRNPSPEAFDRVRQTADALMRATARVLIGIGVSAS